MKKQWFCLLLILTVICLFGCRNETLIPLDDYTMKVQLGSTADVISSDNGYSISQTITNSSMIPVQLREVLIFSAYDAQGEPLTIDGSSYISSALDLSSPMGQSLQKNISQHQATFVSEYITESASIHKEGYFSAEELVAFTSTSVYDLSVSDHFADSIVRMDVLILGKPQAYPYADWELLASNSQLILGSNAPAAQQISARKTTLPNFMASQSYHWEQDHGNALLKDIGSVRETQIMIPATVSLSKTADGYMEDPIYGTVYNTVVAGDAFFGLESLESVTFADGVAVLDNSMYASFGRGMFQNCTALTTVNNIPDTVISMKNTFSGCTAMECTPTFPETVQDMTNCFWRCSSLREVAPLPGSLVCMNSTFRECSALPTIPDLPEGVKDLTRCFYECTAITEVTSLPDSVVDMTGCFYYCTALTTVTEFPASLKNINTCFSGCCNLQTVAALPEGVENLSGCFYACVSLTEFPTLPDSVANMSNTFADCTGLTEVPRWPASIENLYGCFSGCTNLSSVPTIPNSVADWGLVGYHLQETFWGCDSLETVSIDCCSNAISAEDTADRAKVIFTVPHNTSGLCDGCHYVNGTFNADGLTVRTVDISANLFDMLIPWLEDNIPDALKNTCSSITFTTNWNTSAYKDAMGYALYPSGAVYIRCEDIVDAWFVDLNKPETLQYASEYELAWIESTVYHELAHCYDTNFSTYHRFANSAEWMSLHKEEGSFFIISEENYAPYEFPLETFARATSRYFCDPETLQDNCPGMYAYIDTLFGNNNP